MFKINNKDRRRQWPRSGIFIVNFEHISRLFLVFLSFLTAEDSKHQFMQSYSSQANIQLLKVNHKKTEKYVSYVQINSKITRTTSLNRFGVFVVNFEHNSWC